jgi:hypothetical protein
MGCRLHRGKGEGQVFLHSRSAHDAQANNADDLAKGHPGQERPSQSVSGGAIFFPNTHKLMLISRMRRKVYPTSFVAAYRCRYRYK